MYDEYVLHPFIDSFVIVYLENIIIFISTWEDHISHLKQVLDTWMRLKMLKNLNNVIF